MRGGLSLAKLRVWIGSIGKPLVSAIWGIHTPVTWAGESEGFRRAWIDGELERFRRVAWANLEVSIYPF